jgi:predicted enzyme related to lactoylglutathione lyase
LRKLGVFLIASAALFVIGSAPGAAGNMDAGEREELESSNPVVFWELASNDAEASVQFFEGIFDWKIEKIPDTIIHGVESRSGEKGIEGGIFTLQKAKLPFLTIYILVDDIEEKARLVKERGGLVIEEPHEISAGTWICLFNDPSGVTFAMLQKTSVKK